MHSGGVLCLADVLVSNLVDKEGVTGLCRTAHTSINLTWTGQLSESGDRFSFLGVDGMLSGRGAARL